MLRKFLACCVAVLATGLVLLSHGPAKAALFGVSGSFTASEFTNGVSPDPLVASFTAQFTAPDELLSSAFSTLVDLASATGFAAGASTFAPEDLLASYGQTLGEGTSFGVAGPGSGLGGNTDDFQIFFSASVLLSETAGGPIVLPIARVDVTNVGIGLIGRATERSGQVVITRLDDVPEPTTLLLFGGGLATLGVSARRRRTARR